MNLNPNVVINPYELNVYLKETIAPDELVATSGSYISAINAASQLIQTRIGYNLFSGSKQSEIFNGRGWNPLYGFYHDTVEVKRKPIVYSPELFFRCDSDSWTQSTHPFSWDPITGAIWLTDGSCFRHGIRNWKVEYVYGYKSINEVPSDLKEACCMIAQAFIQMGEEGQVTSETSGDITRSYTLKIPQPALDIIDRYRS